MTKETQILNFQDPVWQTSFGRFLAIEVLHQFRQIGFDKTLAPLLNAHEKLPTEDALCWDISISLAGQTFLSRLFISQEFRDSWVEHFSQQQYSSALTEKMSQLVNVTIHIEAGQTHCSLKEWSEVQVGDWIMLDSCSLNQENLEGRVSLTINEKPAFRAKIKDGNLKILELPLSHEVYTPMAKHKEEEERDDLEEEEDFDEFEDEDEFDEYEDEEENEEELTDADFEEGEEEEEEPEVEEEPEEEEPEEEEEEPFEGEEDLFTEEEEQEEEMPTALAAPEEGAVEEIKEEAVSSSLTKKAGLVSLEDIPVTLVVEIGRVQMSVEEVLKLEPGNMLQLNLQPENGVDLVIQGKVVGRGELLRLGESLGVRVTELGS